MKVQRLIEKYKKLEGVWDAEGAELARKIFIEDLKQLDERQPVKVPPFVAVWYRINKDDLDKNIAYLCSNWEKSTSDNNLFNWMSNTDNFIEILVNMRQFGYEVEEEKRYLVKMKGLGQNKSYLNFNLGGVWLFYNADDFAGYRAHHTRKDLEEAGFGWVFDCEGIEVEEVE